MSLQALEIPEEKNAQTPETPLLPQNKKSDSKLETVACFLVALPTSFLNGLAATATATNYLRPSYSTQDLADFLKKADGTALTHGVLALAGSQIVLYSLNRRYLIASGKAAADLVRRDILMLKSLCARTELRPEDRAGVAENILLALSMTTSLLFGEIGAKTLSFLGDPGLVLGFSLNYGVYFTTRSAAAQGFHKKNSDSNWLLKENYLDKLEILPQKTGALGIGIPIASDGTDAALMRFLQKIDAEWDSLPSDKKREISLKYIAPILGWALVCLTSVPLMAGLLPSSVGGAESITHLDIGESDNYQNAGSFTFGIFATALTLFFYELNIKKLPKHFMKTALAIYEKITSGDRAGAMKLFGLTVSAFAASYLTGIGFKFVADSALRSGYLSYLGSAVSRVVPAGLFTGTISMLWSHLQDLINQADQPKITIEEISDNGVINLKVAQILLSRPKTNIAELLNFSMFKQDHKKVYAALERSESADDFALRTDPDHTGSKSNSTPA